MEHLNDRRDNDDRRPPATVSDGAGSTGTNNPCLGRRAADLAGAGVLFLSVYALALLGHGSGLSP